MKPFITLLIILCVTAPVSIYAADPTGWHWYNAPANKPHSKKENRAVKAFDSMTPVQQMHTLQYIFANLKDKAILTGSVSDIANYKEMQDFFVNKATRFSVGWSKMLMLHPELNYALQHPHSNQLAHNELSKTKQQEMVASNIIGREYGFLYFYHGDSANDIIYMKIVKRFIKTHNIATKYINVDKPENKVRANQLGVNYFPAIMLFDPKTRSHTIFRYGFGVDSDLAKRAYEILTNWNPQF